MLQLLNVVQKCMIKPRVLSYFFVNYLPIDFILVVKHPEDVNYILITNLVH